MSITCPRESRMVFSLVTRRQLFLCDHFTFMLFHRPYRNTFNLFGHVYFVQNGDTYLAYQFGREYRFVSVFVNVYLHGLQALPVYITSIPKFYLNSNYVLSIFGVKPIKLSRLFVLSFVMLYVTRSE